MLGAIELRAREQVALGERDLPPEDLLLAADVPADVDPLDVDLGALGDLQPDGHRPVFEILADQGRHVRRGVPRRAVEPRDPVHGLVQLLPGEHVSRLEQDLPPDVLERQHPVAGDVQALHLELRPLHDLEGDGDPSLLPVDGNVVRLHPRLEVAVVVVEREDELDVVLELLALHRTAQDEVLALLGLHDPLDLFGGQPLVTRDDDLVDGDPPPFGDAKRHPHVAVGELLDPRRDLDLEVAILLVQLLEPLRGLLDLDRVVDAPELQLGLLLERVRVDPLVADELHVTDEGALDDDERDLDATLEVLDAHLDVVEEPEPVDRPQVLAQAVRIEGGADRRLHAAEDDGVLHAAVALDGDVLDDDRRRRRRLGPGPRRRDGREHKKNGEKNSPRPDQRTGLARSTG